jgi:hypothetical protein
MTKSKLRIGIDFDKIFVNYPPIVPGSLIEYLYKRKNRRLKYRIPGEIEKKIRVLSHIPLLRPPIKRNIDSLKKIFNRNNSSIYLISSRFSFLKGRTESWDKKHKISQYFKKMYFNFNDEQPHIFKNKIIKKEGIRKFIDDDLDLLMYLSQENPKVEFYWISSNRKHTKLPANITKIKDLEELREKYL